jgi:inner membrane protein
MAHEIQSLLERNAVLIKVAAISFLTLMLLIPMSMIQSLVMERQARQMEATTEISSKWGFQQKISGPILTVPFQTYDLDKDSKRVNIVRHMAYFLPEQLKISGDLKPEVRKRGIFEVAVYTSGLKVEGFFRSPQVDLSDKSYEISWNDAFITLGISDLRGIKEDIKFKWNGTEMNCEPGVKLDKMIESGVTINKPLQSDSKINDYNFSFDLSLNGSKGISFVPMGKETTVSISSTWTNPSFDGSFLPEKREITSDGFNAEWKVLELNRNFPQKWNDNEVEFNTSAFGVSLLLPIEAYQITERSMKYSILFIILTFTVFFFVEIMRKLRVHPIQYVLVGFSLCLFYLLLLSLSEQIGFGLAYLIASAGIVIMIASYSKSIFHNNRLTVILSSILILLYGFLYILIQMQDFALLMGSVALFIILASVMYLSRKIDWYSIGGKAKERDD